MPEIFAYLTQDEAGPVARAAAGYAGISEVPCPELMDCLTRLLPALDDKTLGIVTAACVRTLKPEDGTGSILPCYPRGDMEAYFNARLNGTEKRNPCANITWARLMCVLEAAIIYARDTGDLREEVERVVLRTARFSSPLWQLGALRMLNNLLPQEEGDGYDYVCNLIEEIEGRP